MSNETLFYICGIVLAVSAVAVSFAGLRFKEFPGRFFPVVVLWFAVLVGSGTTFAVLNAKDEQDAKAAELAKANEEIEKAETSGPFEGEEASEGGEKGSIEKEPVEPTEEGAKGPGGTLQLAADPTQLAFDKTSLTSKPGKVTIDFDNPSAIPHDVAIVENGTEVAVSKLIAEGKSSVSADLAPGTYTFLCNVPGHAEAGMEGTLTVR
jgi:plastocyanin